MNIFIYLLFLSIFFLDYLVFKLDLISPYVGWLPDILSMLAVILVILRATRPGNAIAGKYIVWFLCLVGLIGVGLTVNGTSAGPLIVGIRNYLKFLPFFFIPAVYDFTEKQIRRQMGFLLFLVLLQGPLALFQKFVQFGVRSTGDYISGTLSSGGQLPILAASAIAMVTAFYLRGRITMVTYVAILSVMLIPVMLSESKASIGYLPLAFMVPILLNSRPGKKGKKSGARILAILMLFSVVGVTFVAVYDYFAQFGRESRRGGIVEFFISGEAETYLNRGAVDARRVTKTGYVDVVLLPLAQLSHEPFKLMFGLGIGSVSASGSAIAGLSEGATNYYKTYIISIGSSASLFLWEIGVLGLLIYIVFYFMILRDAKTLSRSEEYWGVIGLGWTGVVAVAFLALFFRDIFQDGALGYTFWYMSGLVAASAVRVKRRMPKKPRELLLNRAAPGFKAATN